MKPPVYWAHVCVLFAEPVFHQPDRGPLYGAERDQSSPAGENRPRIQVRYSVVHVFCIRRTLLTLILILKYQNLDSKGMKMAQMYTCLLLVWQHKNVTSVCSYIFRVSCVIDCHWCYFGTNIQFHSCAVEHQWCGIFHCHWLTAAIKLRLLFSPCNFSLFPRLKFLINNKNT